MIEIYMYFILLYESLARCTNPVSLLSLKDNLWNLAFGFNHDMSQVVSCIIKKLLIHFCFILILTKMLVTW